MEQTITPTTEPEFLEFAAIQFFAAMINNAESSTRPWPEFASRAWNFANMLFEAKPQPAQDISKEMTIILLRMQTDSDLAWTWHSNIAVAFMDEGGSHKQANEAAARFMLSAFGVDVRLSEQWKNMVAMINTDE